MEITITPSFIFQISSLLFTSGGIFVWVRISIKSLLENQHVQEESIAMLKKRCEALKELVNDIQHLHISREDAYKAFVTKEVIDLHLKNLGEDMAEVKKIVQLLHGKGE